MKRIFLEIISVLFVVAISIVSAFYLFNYLALNRQTEREVKLSGKVEKIPLKIASPYFTIIDEYKVNVGQEVKKGDVIAILRYMSTPDEEVQLNEDLFSTQEDSLFVHAPADGVVAEVYLAEKSTVKPLLEFISLYTYEDSRIRFATHETQEIVFDQPLLLENSDKVYALEIMSTLPIKLADGEGKAYYAQFKDSKDSKDFYNNQEIEIKLITDKESIGTIQKIDVQNLLAKIPWL